MHSAANFLLLFSFLLPTFSTAARPAFSEKNATAWRSQFACETKEDCPTYFDCYNPETKILAEGSPLSDGVGGICECYWVPGKGGDDCTERGANATVQMIIFIAYFFMASECARQSVMILFRLKQLNSLDLSKPGNKTLCFVIPTCCCLAFYMLCLLLNNLNLDESGFITDKLRLLIVALMIVFLQLSNLQIASTWISIGGSAGKKNVQFKDYPPNIKTALWACTFLKYLSVIVVIGSVALGKIQVIRLFTFLQFIAVAIFYYFGANKLASMLTPTRASSDDDEGYAKKCEPATKIKSAGHICCLFAILYLLFAGASSGFLVSMEQGKGQIGTYLFMCSMLSAGGLMFTFVAYCRFGVKKTLARGGKSGTTKIAPTTTASSTASSVG
mmetsp:Transcript_28658/g.54128  ORF Transcript_28658/g.54128 Transcript_28658/m.54128 type:complete len:387 (+) Transcript_28658:133-1293(+)